VSSAQRLSALCAAAFIAAASACTTESTKPIAEPAPKALISPASTTVAPPAVKPAGLQLPKPPPAVVLPTTSPKADAATVLPVFPVSASRLKQIDVQINRLEKQITREAKLLDKSDLDDTLNNETVSGAAALFGGKSTVQRESVAAVRIESMQKELQLLEALRTPLTNDDRALIEKLIEDQQVYRRNLDEALR